MPRYLSGRVNEKKSPPGGPAEVKFVFEIISFEIQETITNLVSKISEMGKRGKGVKKFHPFFLEFSFLSFFRHLFIREQGCVSDRQQVLIQWEIRFKL